MTGLLRHLAPIKPPELRDRTLANDHERLIQELLCGRRLHRAAVEEVWRLWPALSQANRVKIIDLFWHGGVTSRLLLGAAGKTGTRRAMALNRIFALADPRTLGPLLSLWPHLTTQERAHVLAFANGLNHPGLASLLWREVALRSPDPPGEMARLARFCGPGLIKALGAALSGRESPIWAWETLARVGGVQAEEYMLGCIGRRDALGERAKQRYASLPSEIALPLLMETARSHPAWEARIGAVTVLLGRKEPQALRFLTELLRDRDWYDDPTCEARPRGWAWPALFGLDRSGV